MSSTPEQSSTNKVPQSSVPSRSAKRKLEYDEDTLERSKSDLLPAFQSATPFTPKSPPLKKRIVPTANIVTPPKDEEEDDQITKQYKAPQEKYVPKHIHKNLDYVPQGDSKPTKTIRKTFELIQKHYNIPDDLEQSPKYGPLSGSCFEERVISAYALDLLPPITDAKVLICTNCAALEHKREDCPKLI
jgi:hypothetical protein